VEVRIEDGVLVDVEAVDGKMDQGEAVDRTTTKEDPVVRLGTTRMLIMPVITSTTCLGTVFSELAREGRGSEAGIDSTKVTIIEVMDAATMGMVVTLVASL
jgi:hypothetical protein